MPQHLTHIKSRLNRYATGLLCLLVFVSFFGITAGGCSKEKFPEKFTADRDAFDQSLLAFWQAKEMFRKKQGQSMVFRTADKEKVYFETMIKGVVLSEKISDEFLDFLHPQLKEMYRGYLINGKRNYVLGSVKGDRFSQTQGSQLVLKWEEFWGKNQEGILAKLYPNGKPQES